VMRERQAVKRATHHWHWTHEVGRQQGGRHLKRKTEDIGRLCYDPLLCLHVSSFIRRRGNGRRSSGPRRSSSMEAQVRLIRGCPRNRQRHFGHRSPTTGTRKGDRFSAQRNGRRPSPHFGSCATAMRKATPAQSQFGRVFGRQGGGEGHEGQHGGCNVDFRLPALHFPPFPLLPRCGSVIACSGGELCGGCPPGRARVGVDGLGDWLGFLSPRRHDTTAGKRRKSNERTTSDLHRRTTKSVAADSVTKPALYELGVDFRKERLILKASTKVVYGLDGVTDD